MEIEAILKNPICIRLGKSQNVIIENENGEEEYPLAPGVMFSGEHYGFILISETNGRLRETIYPTHRTIQAIGMDDAILSVFEEGKEKAWTFNKIGRLIHSNLDEPLTDGLTKADIFVRNEDLFTSDPLLLNPVRIRIYDDPEKSRILGDDPGDIEYPLYPGAMLGSLHYGFVIIKGEDGSEVEQAYPTQNRIDTVGIEGSSHGDLKVFEDGKYNPWRFTFNGELIEKSSYNPLSKRDKEFADTEFGLSDTSKDSFQLKK